MYTPPTQSPHLTRIRQDHVARDVRDARRRRPRQAQEHSRPGRFAGASAALRGLVARREVSR